MSFASRQERSSSAKKLVRLEYDAALFAQGDQAVSLESSRNWAAHIRQYGRSIESAYVPLWAGCVRPRDGAVLVRPWQPK
jgi:hypothetical protein